MLNDHDMQQLRDQLDLLVRNYMQANYCGSTSATDAVAFDLLKKLRETERMLATREAELAEADKALVTAVIRGGFQRPKSFMDVSGPYKAALAREAARQAARAEAAQKEKKS